MPSDSSPPTEEDVKLAAALDEGIADIEAGRYVEGTPEDLMAEILADVGLAPTPHQQRVRESAKRVMAAHRETLTKLAK